MSKLILQKGMTSCQTEIGAQEQSPISTEVLKIDNDQQNKEGRTIFGKKRF